jgi:hypothetical protein
MLDQHSPRHAERKDDGPCCATGRGNEAGPRLEASQTPTYAEQRSPDDGAPRVRASPCGIGAAPLTRLRSVSITDLVEPHRQQGPSVRAAFRLSEVRPCRASELTRTCTPLHETHGERSRGFVAHITLVGVARAAHLARDLRLP